MSAEAGLSEENPLPNAPNPDDDGTETVALPNPNPNPFPFDPLDVAARNGFVFAYAEKPVALNKWKQSI